MLLFVVIIGLVVLYIRQYQAKEDERILAEMKATEAFTSEYADMAKHDKDLANRVYNYILTHAFTNTGFYELELMSENKDGITLEQEWVAQLAYIYDTNDINSYISLFDPDSFETWYQSYLEKDTMDDFTTTYLVDSYKNIKQLTAYSKKDQYYVKVNYKDGKSKDIPFKLLNNDDTIYWDITAEEWDIIMN